MDFSRTFAYGSIKNLHPHPLNKKLYGEQKSDIKLVESIKAHGVLSPIVVNKKKQILSGHRRWLAAKEVGLTSVPLTGFKGTTAEEELLLIESNRQREKTAEQRAREFIELKRIESELAKERLTLSQGRGIKGPVNLPDVKGDARDIAAEKTGFKSRTAEKLEKIVQAADEGNKKAREALNKINETGRGVDSAYERTLKKQQRKVVKSAVQNRVVELRKLFSHKVELQASKDEGRFNLFFYKQTEAQIREIAKALGCV